MERHINVVAALQIGYSILGLIIAGTLFAVFYLIGDFVDDHEAQFVLSIIANVIMVVSVIVSIPGILAGIGLFKRKEWARILTLIISVLNLFSFPIGTALGIYSIWALVQPEIIEAFKNS
ncbi:oligosaccharide flippase family protein [Prolixibacteraceae bacterium Z1-6]|uniref:Oligosaccharide flippase family protein n=1 Tax=Draconibacterium aestuarii TaxID=2998507 RepID=A0A9X3FAN8_9BACT|nr:oligosaccharide flippase family protein [Prolixibacteraceae bacterium Z1-6]